MGAGIKTKVPKPAKKTPNKLGLKRLGNGRGSHFKPKHSRALKKSAVSRGKKDRREEEEDDEEDEDEGEEDEEDEGEQQQTKKQQPSKLALSPAATSDEQEKLKFGRKLVHPDKKIRDRTIKTLAIFLGKRALPDFEHERLWKAMFYCMWLSDKVPVQQELANNLSNLVHAPSKLNGLPYIRAFWVTIAREWSGIDYLRLDKFYSLMRHFIRHSFQWLQSREWSLTAVQLYSTLLTLTSLNPEDKDVSKSICNHIADVYWEELLKVLPADSKLSAEVTAALLQPFLHLLALTTYEPTVGRIIENILQPLLNSTELMDVRYDDEEATPEGKIAEHLDVTDIPTLIHSYATSRFTLDKFRPKLYDLHKQFATLVASKAPVVPAPAPTLATESKKKGKGKVVEVPEPTAAVTKAEEAPEPAKKQGKKGKGTDEVPEVAAKQQVTNEAAVAPVAKKSKTAVPASEPVEAVKNEKPKGGAKRPAEEQPVPTPQLPSPKRQAKAPVATPSTPVQALAPSTPATPPSGEYVTAPSSPATPSTTAAVTPKTILRTRSSKLGKNATPASEKKNVRIDVQSNMVKPFLRELPVIAVSTPSPKMQQMIAEAQAGKKPVPKSPSAKSPQLARGSKKRASDFF